MEQLSITTTYYELCFYRPNADGAELIMDRLYSLSRERMTRVDPVVRVFQGELSRRTDPKTASMKLCPIPESDNRCEK